MEACEKKHFLKMEAPLFFYTCSWKNLITIFDNINEAYIISNYAYVITDTEFLVIPTYIHIWVL